MKDNKAVILLDNPSSGLRPPSPTRGEVDNVRGFTLIELLVVVLIIGILAAVAVPQYQKAVLKSRYSTLMAGAKAIAEAEEVYFLENGQYTRNMSQLSVSMNAATCSTSVLETQTTSCPEGFYFYLVTNNGEPYVLGTFVIGNTAPLYYAIHFQHNEFRPGRQACSINSHYRTDTKFHQICQSFGGTVGEDPRVYYLN